LRYSLLDQLEPEEALAEVVAGLVMVLTFTLAAGLLTHGGDGDLKTLVIAAVGCNIAWGLIDAALYLLGRKTRRSYHTRFLRRVQLAPDADAAQAAIREEWEPILLDVAREQDRERLYGAMRELALNAKPSPARLRRDDIKGALAIFILVCATAVPAILPFLFLRSDWLALRISNLLLVTLLFLAGYRWGASIDANPALTGLALVALGLALVGCAIALGG
jgi:VIT1/CCC1 family predicted Fe2+/Mn2+ transporter